MTAPEDETCLSETNSHRPTPILDDLFRFCHLHCRYAPFPARLREEESCIFDARFVASKQNKTKDCDPGSLREFLCVDQKKLRSFVAQNWLVFNNLTHARIRTYIPAQRLRCFRTF